MVGEAGIEATLETIVEVGQTDAGMVTAVTMVLCCFKPIRDWWRKMPMITKVAFF